MKLENWQNKNDIKAIVTDLDGTILNSDSEVHLNDIRALKKLGELGVCRIIATGRSLYSYSKVIPDDFPADYLIFSAGAGITNLKTKELIQSVKIPADEVRRLASKLCELEVDFQVREVIPRGHFYMYKRFFSENPDFDRLNHNYAQYASLIDDVSKLPDASRIISIFPTTDHIDLFNSFFHEYSIIRATSPIDHKSVWMEIYPKGVNKGNALSYLLGSLKISFSQTIGLGNDYNDIHFLDITGESYVVDNSPDDLKSKYKTTVGNNYAPLSNVLLLK